MVSHKLLILDIKVIIYLSFSIISMQNAFAQKSYHVLKDTTDSNSIVNKIQNIHEIEVSSKHFVEYKNCHYGLVGRCGRT